MKIEQFRDALGKLFAESIDLQRQGFAAQRAQAAANLTPLWAESV